MAGPMGLGICHQVSQEGTGRPGEWEFYTNGLYFGRKIRRLSTWKGGTFSSALFPDKLANLQGATLRVVTFEFEPSVLYFRERDGKMKYPYGIDIEVVSALSTVLNFTLEFVEPPPGELWGEDTGNGSWNGMVGKLSQNEGDIGVANLFLTLGRLGVIDYSAPYDAEVSCFLARSDPPAPRWKSLSLPFQGETWLAILGGLISSGCVLYLLAIASQRCSSSLSPWFLLTSGGEKKFFQSFLTASQYAFAAHTLETQVTQPARLNMRIFICVLWMYTFIITTAYSSNLTAYLTVVQTPVSMETVKEIYNSKTEVSGLGGFFRGALASSVDPYLQGLADRFEAYGDLNIVWPKVLKGRAVYLHNRQFLEFLIATQFTNKGTSSMRIMKECFSPYNIAMALQRHSPVKKNFDKVISWMLESGLVRRWFLESLRQSRKSKETKTKREGGDEEDADKDEEERSRTQSQRNLHDGVIPLSIDHMQGIFFILSFGSILGVLIFSIELFVGGAQTRRVEK
ncbi:hypothetical protein SK128_027038 [Halocaridina rubra]|uniref:Ionotropic glutamate receptor L-glutamate and glycine-binding domain-containing protein n=1 Tax=Halocaridina rubra TaxID=373956 RepID=A0AAN8XH14_HALRR